MKSPEEIMIELNWDYASDPGRHSLFYGLIKPAMCRYAEQYKNKNTAKTFYYRKNGKIKKRRWQLFR